MAEFRFLHAADLHLDSPLRGLEDDRDAPAERIRNATRAALVNLVDLALDEQAAFVLLAGDLYDGDWGDWRTARFLVGQLARLTAAGIRVIAIRGNHDAASVITRRLELPAGAALLRTDRPETVLLEAQSVAIHGQSFATRDVLENLARHYPPPLPNHLNIGLLHTAASGREGHASYAPCELPQLVAHGYDYWALGHIHAREVLCTSPWVVFAGTTQGRHARETGAKGATLVTVRDGRITSVEHRVLDVVRWERLTIDLANAPDADAAHAIAQHAIAGAVTQAGGRLLALRLSLEGATPAHASLTADPRETRERLRAEAASHGTEAIWLEAVELTTRPALDLAALLARPDALGRLAAAIVETPAAALLAPLAAYATPLLDRASGLRELLGPDHPATRLAQGDTPNALVQRARDLLLAKLAEG